ncbi:hypothetical protein EX895_003757 [Sporisorium graminicola]|uniref:Carrier domain-containing protein n=1 Tax=Sporisorium graminicola TaxID=280036 RepID=A0A4U7KRL7_9BASI|nr:hypothetical protein EX895_003757 [Sporisorium graminicola]TKY87080.1 hypothetical protein EX895_003757 [Sporisorium graminicola]
MKVVASALNFRDVAASMGIIDDFELGDECAGIVLRTGSAVDPSCFKSGDRVVALRPGQGCHQSRVRNPASLCWKLGEMDFADAASLPLILSTAYYTLFTVAQIEAGQSVLIHSAAGGVGQMAVQLAKLRGARVFATVGSASKRKLLRERFDLADDHIFSSRDASFAQAVMEATSWKGVDVVLNSLSGDLLKCSWDCIAPFGTFCEIGKRDIHEDSKLSMAPFRRNVRFASIDLVIMFERNQALLSRVFRESCELVHAGQIQLPWPVERFAYSQAASAFRLMQQGKHTGKLVLQDQPGDLVSVLPSSFEQSAPRLDASKIYLLVGGLGGLCRSLSQWLVRRGARHLVFLSRSGEDRPEARETTHWLRSRGITVQTFKADVARFDDVLVCIRTLGQRLAGIFHAVTVLRDALLSSMSFDQWRTSLGAKAYGATNLHRALEECNVDVDFFVMFSSVSTILGAKAQSNYSAANCYLDFLVRHRRAQGLAASTCNIGMVSGVGLVAEDAALQAIMEKQGFNAVNQEELLAQLSSAIDASRPGQIVDSAGFVQSQSITGVNLAREGLYWSNRPRFAHLYTNNDVTSSSGAGGGRKGGASQNLAAHLASLPTPETKMEALSAAFIEKLSANLGITQESIDVNKPLSNYGLDSLVAVEIRSWFTKTARAEIALFDVLGSPSIVALVSKAVQSLAAAKASTSKADSEPEFSSLKNGTGKTADKATAQDGVEYDIVPRRNATKTNVVPMSLCQTRLWTVHAMSSHPERLNLSVVFHLSGAPHLATLSAAWDALVARNEVLRTAFYEGEDESVQEILAPFHAELPFVDLRSKGSTARDEFEHLQAKQCSKPLDIESGELFSLFVAQLGDEEFALGCSFHHIAVDAGSAVPFLEQLKTLYDTIRDGKELTAIPAPRLQYADYAAWETEQQGSAQVADSESFWRTKFASAPEVSALLPYASVSERLAVPSEGRRTTRSSIPGRLLKRLKRVCTEADVTQFQFFFAAFRCFIFLHTRQNDLTLLMINGARPHEELRDLIGFMVNITPVRCHHSFDDMTFEEALQLIKPDLVSALEHGQTPFERIVQLASAAYSEGSSSKTFPLGQVAINYQVHRKPPVVNTSDFVIDDVATEDIPSGCELNLEAMESDTGLSLRLEYDTTLYADDASMQRMLGNFTQFLMSLMQDHRQPLDEVSLSGSEEIGFQREKYWNIETKTEDLFDASCVAQRIIHLSQKQPEAIAARTSQGEEITYASLVAEARDIAATLQADGVGRGGLIALLSYPGIHCLKGMLAAHMTGNGYAGLDPTFSEARLAFMVRDCGARALLTTTDLADTAKRLLSSSPSFEGLADAKNLTTLYLDHFDRASPTQLPPFQADSKPAIGADPFYVVYSSGSTGAPKGILLTQDNTRSMLLAMQSRFNFGKGDRFLWQSSMSFDLSVVQIFSALCAGGTILIAKQGTRSDPEALAAFMVETGPTVTYFTPTQFTMILESAADEVAKLASTLRFAMFAGERLPVRLAQRFYEVLPTCSTKARVYNTWSPSEVVVQTTIADVEAPQAKDTSIPIGYPLANCRHYICNKRLEVVPVGVEGEICVGGAQVGDYLNRPEQSARSFVNNPFATEDDVQRGWTRVFRTGDRGVLRPDGQLEFRGRIAGDKQVKLRGYRMDLGEVEQALFQAAKGDPSLALADVYVVARNIDTANANANANADADDRSTVAFVVPKESRDTKRAQQELFHGLEKAVAAHLNPYMLPSFYVQLASLPTTVGGKVNRLALMQGEYDFLRPVLPSSSPDEFQPSSGTSQVTTHSDEANEGGDKTLSEVVGIFRTILRGTDASKINEDSDFFKAGGTSLLVVRLQSRLKRTFGFAPTIATIVKQPTPRSIAAALVRARGSAMANTSTKVPTMTTAKKADVIPWTDELALVDNLPSVRDLPDSTVKNVLLTGADTFIGAHVLADLISREDCPRVFVIGTSEPISEAKLLQVLNEFHLLDGLDTSKIEAVPEARLDRENLGLTSSRLSALADDIGRILHCASEVSLLRSYKALRPVNVLGTLALLRLAGYNGVVRPLHYLSTWSVPHLATWTTASSRQAKRLVQPAAPDSFMPDSDNALGYFKTRWASEMLLTRAADENKGYRVSIYRASAASGNSKTLVHEPDQDFVRQMVVSMIHERRIPRLHNDFVVDFVPVNYISQSITVLASTRNVWASSKQGAQFYHLSNPNPLPLAQLADRIGEILGEAGTSRAEVVDLATWLAPSTSQEANEGSEMAKQVLASYFALDHTMHALDTVSTTQRLAQLGVEPCPPVFGALLRGVARLS